MHDTVETAVVASVPESTSPMVGVRRQRGASARRDTGPRGAGTLVGCRGHRGRSRRSCCLADDRQPRRRLADRTSRRRSDGADQRVLRRSPAGARRTTTTSPLRWFPALAVTETDDGSGFPRPHYALADAVSDPLDARARVGYARCTPSPTPQPGCRRGADPRVLRWRSVPVDDQLADGEATLHDRALAMIRVAIVNLDRVHVDPARTRRRIRHDRRHHDHARHDDLDDSLAYTADRAAHRAALRSARSSSCTRTTRPTPRSSRTPLDALAAPRPGRPDADVHRPRSTQLIRAARRAAA